MEDSLNVRVNSILTSGRKDKTLTYFQYVKEESSGRGVDEVLEGKVNKTDQLTSEQFSKGSVTSEILADSSVVNRTIANKSVTSVKLGDESVLVSKIAQEVWDKIQDEYLRRDGKNSMKSDASIGFGDINSVTLSKDGMSFLDGIVEVTKKGLSFDHDESSYSSYGDKVILFETADYEGSVNVVLFKVNDGNVFARDTVSAKGFLINDRTNIGLLVNDGTVGLALTDSEIDNICSNAFNFVIG